MKKLSVYFFLLVVHFNLFGQIQNPNFDSLIKYKLFDPQKAIKFGFDGISSLENNENKILEFHFYYQLGEIFNNLNLYSEAIEFLTKGSEILDKIPTKEINKNEQVQYGWIDINIGNIFFKTKNFDKAKNHYENAKILFENNNKLSLEQKIYGLNTAENNLALIEIEKGNFELAKKYMGIEENQKVTDLKFDKVFIGSCTNSRIEDLREAAKVVEGKKVSKDIIEAIVVPGSGLVKEQAESEGLNIIFENAGFIWRDPGCSMCLGMNPDQLKPYERCASTSNRNFEGRQGNLGRTHLMSPLMAALTAVNGKIVDPS